MNDTLSPLGAQLSMDLDIPTSRKLIPIEAANVLLDRDEDQVLALIESGKLVWAWDIRHPEAKQREIRIWRNSLLAHLSGDWDAHSQISEEAVLQHVLNHRRPEVRSTDLQRCWSCSQTHVHALIVSGCLGPAKQREQIRGSNAVERIAREHLLTFLRQRRLH
ncbi:MAG: hypothetical protein VW338_08625 [Rhodospirillaceae bacterium]